MSNDMMKKAVKDMYESTIIDFMEDAVHRIQSNTDHREYVEQQSDIVAICITELKRRREIKD